VPVYSSPTQLAAAELAALAHLAWFVVPLTLLAGVYALREFLKKTRDLLARYLHAGFVVMLWLVAIGARYYAAKAPSVVRPGSLLWMDLALVSLACGSTLGLTLRHTAPSRRQTPQVLIGHVFFAFTTAVLTVLGLLAYG
jgi:hypothetical protein